MENEDNGSLLVVFESEGQNFIGLTPDSYIQAFHSKPEIMSAFEGFVRFGTGTYENVMSSTIGLLHIKPIAVRLKQEQLKDYITDMRPYKLQSMAISPINTVKCSKEILKYREFDIWHEISEEIKYRLQK